MLKLCCSLESRGLAQQLERALQSRARTEWVVEIPRRGQASLIGYFESQAAALLAFEALRADVPGLPLNPEVHPLSDGAWQESYRDHFQATRAGRFLLVPSWAEEAHEAHEAHGANEAHEANRDAIVLRLDPGLTFGTDHPTTRLCLAALEAFAAARAELAPCRFIDAGSGSGVLSIAALLAGFGAGFAFDTDPVAVARTRENAERNGVVTRLLARECGIEAGLDEPADLVFANIHHNVLVAHREQLLSAVRPGGVLILSGCLEADRASLQAAFEAVLAPKEWGLRHICTSTEAGWSVIEIARQSRSTFDSIATNS